MKMNRRGFTLTEILIVIVVLAVVAAFVLPRFFGQDEKGILAEAVTTLSAIRMGEAGYHLEHSAYYDMDTTKVADDAKWDDIGIDKPDTGNFDYSVAGGVSTAKRNGGNADFNGTTVILNADGTWDQTATHPFKPK